MGALRAPMLGREMELTALQAAYREAQGGPTVLIIVAAEPGAGKSRLLAELVAWLRSDGRRAGPIVIRRAHADAGGNRAMEPVSALLRAAIAGRGGDMAVAVASGVGGEGGAPAIADVVTLAQALRSTGMAEARADVVAHEVAGLAWPDASTVIVGAADALGDRDARFEGWCEALEALGGTAMAVDIVEDLHWASDDLLAWLRARSGRASPSGQLIVCSTRPLDADRLAALGVDAPDPQPATRMVELGPLADTDGRQLVEALVGRALPERLLADVVDASRGNPLFIEELLRTWIGAGTMAPGADGRWELTDQHDEVSLPLRVATIYAAQLDDLPAAPRRTAQLASVAGRRFADALLPALGSMDPTPDLDVLERRALLRPERLDLPSLPGHAFRHALLRDAAYASMSRSDRARSHVRAAAWLRTFPDAMLAALAGSIAGHYARALETAPRLAMEVGEGLDRQAVAELAAAWFERSADAANAQGAPGEAAGCIGRVLELRPDATAIERADLTLRLGRATAAAGDLGAARAHLEMAASLARSGLADHDPATRRRARSLFGRAVAAVAEAHFAEVHFAAAADEAGAAVDELGTEDLDDAAGWVLLAHAHAVHAVRPGDVAADAEIDRALAISRMSGQRELELEAMRTAAASRGETGEALASDWDPIIELALALGRTDVVLSSRINQVSFLVDDEAPAAGRFAAEATVLAVALGDQERVGWCHELLVEAALASGDWEAADAAGRSALRIAEAGGFGRLAVRTWHALLPIMAQRGDTAAVEDAAAWFELRAPGFPDSSFGRMLLAAARSWFAVAGVRPREAPDLGRLLPSFGLDPTGPAWLMGVVRVASDWIEIGDVESATKATRALEHAIARYRPSRLAMATLALVEARLARAQAASPDVVAHKARTSMATSRGIGAAWWELAALRELAAVHRAEAGDAAHASALAARLGSTGGGDA